MSLTEPESVDVTRSTWPELRSLSAFLVLMIGSGQFRPRASSSLSKFILDTPSLIDRLSPPHRGRAAARESPTGNYARSPAPRPYPGRVSLARAVQYPPLPSGLVSPATRGPCRAGWFGNSS